MIKNVALLTSMTLLVTFSFEVQSANSIENLRTNFAQVASETCEAPKNVTFKQKIGRKLFRQKIRAALENASALSFGGVALLLILSSIIVFCFMPPILNFLSLGFYMVSLVFSLIGLSQDKKKAPAIIAFILAMLPIVLLIAFFIECRIHGCFD